jgi:hypothetical protein
MNGTGVTLTDGGGVGTGTSKLDGRVRGTPGGGTKAGVVARAAPNPSATTNGNEPRIQNRFTRMPETARILPRVSSLVSYRATGAPPWHAR